MDLIQELTVGYFQDRFNGCLFYGPEGQACYIDNTRPMGRSTVPVTKVSGPASKPVVENIDLPHSFFKDLSVFKVPSLGWRAAAQGRYLVYLSRNNRSYQRCVAPANLNTYFSPATQYLIDTDNISYDYYTRSSIIANMVLLPEYTPFHKGVDAMRKGELYSFCASPNLAVIPDVDNKLAIYFNTNRVGTVQENNSIDCTIPLVSKLIKESP